MPYSHSRLIGSIGIAALAAFGSQAAYAECGRVTVASMNWQSAEVLAEIDRIVLSEGYGCEVELVPGDTMPTLTSMIEKGQPDVAPEAWTTSVLEPLTAAINEGRLHYGARSLRDGGVEGWWIPKFIADANPEIKTIEDALSRPDLFPSPDDKKKGAVHNCPAGWNCQITTGNAFKAWGAKAKGFVLVPTGSAAGPFGAYLRQHRGEESLVVDQGSDMGSPSRLYVDTTVGIAVAGAVRVVSTGTYHLPGEGDPR